MARIKHGKRIRLAHLFVRYTVWFIVTTLVSLIMATWLYVFVARVTGIIIEIPWTQSEIDSMRQAMAEEGELNAGIFPIRSEYAIFTADGDFLYGSADPEEQQWLWDQYRQRGVYADTRGICVEKDGEIRIATLYFEKIAFRDEWLQSVFPVPGFSAVLLFLVFFLSGIGVLSTRYARRLATQLDALKQATQRIQAQDLEFSVGHSEIREIDEVLISVNSMKEALQTALAEQWAMERERSEQIAALTHDVQTPLTIIRGNAELIGHSGTLAQAKEYGQYIERNAGLISEYVKALDDVQGQSMRWPADDLWNELCAMLKSMCATKQIVFVARGMAPEGSVWADQSALIRAFANVFDNAVRYTPDGGSIRLCVEQERDWVRFTVRDSGTGFSEEALRHATKRSFTEKEDQTGHGMGLYTTDITIGRLGGRLKIWNDAESGGGVVEVSIPA